MAFLVFVWLVSLLQDILITGQFMTLKNSSKTQLYGICIGQLFILWSNFLTWFFLMNMNERRYWNSLVAGTFAKRLSVNDILRCS